MQNGFYGLLFSLFLSLFFFFFFFLINSTNRRERKVSTVSKKASTESETERDNGLQNEFSMSMSVYV